LALARRLVTTDPRRTLREALRGELAQALVGPQQAAILDELQATMAVIEGYAEHVMDAAASGDDGLEGLRNRMDERRARRSGVGDVIARALGLGMKLRQYELGKAWSDTVAADAGIEGLNRVWAEPAALPSLAELERPADWLARVAPAPVG
jgi:putative hydrolase